MALISFSFSNLTSFAQSTLNVTNYGAKGDAVQVWVSTVANSPAVTFTNSLSDSDVGKTVTLIGVGQSVVGPGIGNYVIAGQYWINNLPTNYHCTRLLGVITNITEGTNVYVHLQGAYKTAAPSTTANLVKGQPAILDAITNYPTKFQSRTTLGTNFIGKGIDIQITALYDYFKADAFVKTFGGFYIYSSPMSTNRQGVVATITKVVGNTAYLSGDWPTVTSNGVYCLYGTDNAKSFQAAVNTVKTSNVTINVPPGNYLILPPSQYTNYVPSGDNVSLFSAALHINKGGFSFVGESPTNTIITTSGAWKQKSGWWLYNYDLSKAGVTPRNAFACVRGSVFQCRGPITNNYPIAFRNLAFDGGLPVALTGYQSEQPANAFSGNGWDGTSSVGYDSGWGDLNVLKTFDNCEFRHFMGEVIKGITGSDGNGAHTIVTNCYFWDGNATAFNYNTSHTITDCTFSNMYQIEEFYLKYSNTRPSWFINNYATNITHNFVSLNGGTLTNQPYIISNNVLQGAINGNGIASSPAANVIIASNRIYGTVNSSLAAIVIGQNGAQNGTSDAINRNYSIYGNYIENAASGVILAEGKPNTVAIHHNTFVGKGVNFVKVTQEARNVHVYSNDLTGVTNNIVVSTGNGLHPYANVPTNNNYWSTIILNGEWGPTNRISYAGGSRYRLSYPYKASVPNHLVTKDGALISKDAILLITNANLSRADVRIYLSEGLTNSVIVPYATMLPFYWTGTEWSTNPPAQPNSFRFLE